MPKPEKLGNVWPSIASFQIIDGNKWKTLSWCVDTPVNIDAEIKHLIGKGYKLGELWVRYSIDKECIGREMALDKYNTGKG